MAKKKTSKVRKQSVQVKNRSDVLASINGFIFKNVHDRHNLTFSSNTKEKIVSYGPWLAIAALLIIAPELLVLAKDATFISFSGFIETILFNRTSWVLLIILFINCLLLVDGLEDLFAQKRRGWNRIYIALLINITYVIYQLFARIEQPAAPILALVGFIFCLFTLLDVRDYYKQVSIVST